MIILALLLSALLFSACQFQQNDKKFEEFVFNPDTVSTRLQSSISDIRYIPLESTENSLIGDINKIVYRNGYFYIFDKNVNMGVQIFDRKGKFQKALYRLGEGPGEYIAPIDFDVDNSGNIYIADNARQKIIRYNINNFDDYKEFDIEHYFMEFAITENGDILLSDVYEGGRIKDKLAIWNAQTKTLQNLIKPTFPTVNELKVMRASGKYLFRSDDEIYFYPRFSPSVYGFQGDDTSRPLVRISTNRLFDEESLHKLEGKPHLFAGDQTHIKDISAFYKVDGGYLCALKDFPLPKFYHVFPDKKGAFQVDLIREAELLGNLDIKGVADDHIFVVSQHREEAIQYALAQNCLQEENKEVLLKWKEDENPMLILFKVQSK